jgi:fructokinase
MIPTAFPGKLNGYLPFTGGSPYNTAIAIGRLGTPVMFLGKFSKDFFGEMLMKRLQDNHVREDLVIRSEQNSTLAFVKLEKDKNPQYVFYTEGTADRSLSIDDLPKKIPADIHCICFGSIAMTMEPLASAIETLILRENTLQVQGKISPVISYDPNIRPFMIKDKKAFIERMQKWIAASTITKISAEDFSFIFPGLEPEKALHKILAMGPRMAIVTLGPKGAMALLRRNDGSLTKVVAPIIDLPVKDTIGAGDAFHGAFLSWLERNEKMSRTSLATLTETELYDALFFANKAASIICNRQGAEPPTLREVENLKIKKPESKSVPAKKAPSKSDSAATDKKKEPTKKPSPNAAAATGSKPKTTPPKAK